jgi:hypothetical protein
MNKGINQRAVIQALNAASPKQVTVDICLDDRPEPIGRLVFVRDGQREFSQFAYAQSWLSDAEFF